MKKLVVIAIVLLALLGSFTAIVRATVVIGMLRGAPANELTDRNRATLRFLAGMIGVDDTSPQYRELEDETRAGAARFNALPYATLFHVIAGAAFLLLAPLQLIPRLRLRRHGVHRRMGYVLLACGIPFGVTGLYFTFREPSFGLLGATASGLAGGWFLYSATRAYAAIRRRDIEDHRAWMLRALAMAYASAVIRAISLIVLAIVPVRLVTIGAPTFWAGFLLSALAAEWWIRRTSKPASAALRWAS